MRRRWRTYQSAIRATAASSWNRWNPCEKNTAITRIAPKSSTTASVSRNARSALGSDEPTIARTASANAISVAVGTAQPCGLPSFIARLVIR